MLGASRGKYSRENTNLRHHGGVIDRMSKAAVARVSTDFFRLHLERFVNFDADDKITALTDLFSRTFLPLQLSAR